MSKRIHKPISVLTSVTTAVWLSGVAMLAPMGAMAIVDGDIVSPDAEFIEGDITYYPYDVFIVKMIGTKTFKRLILNPEVFESYGHLEWGNIQTISAATVDGYTTSDLVRAIDGTKVYQLVPDGDTGTREWLDMTAAAFTAAGHDWDAIYVVNTTDLGNYTDGGVVDDGDVTSEGTLTVTLAADTPAAGATVSGAARYPFTKINLTATGGDVIVDSMTVERTGTIAADGAFSSLAFILDTPDGDQLGNNKTLNASHQTVLNDDLTIRSGTTKSVYLTGNMGTIGATYAGQMPSLTLAAMTLKGDATLNATLPITGNYQSLAGTITIGTATIVAGGNAPSASTQNVGITDYTVSAIKITADSAEAITVAKIVWTQDGSVGASDVENVDLVNANTGEVLDTIEHPEGKTLTFNPNITIAKGKNQSFDLRLDIIDGSGRNISYDIDEQTDILVKGGLYGYYITPTYTGKTARPYYDAPDTAVGNGSLRIEAMSVVPTTVAEDKAGVTLGKFKFVAKGEEVKITEIGWEFVITTSTAGALISDITNVAVYDEDGTVVAGPMDPTSDDAMSDGADTDSGAATTTDTIIIPVGEAIYTIKGDLSADFNANDKIQMGIIAGTITARGMITDNSIDATPVTKVSSTNLTVKAAALTITVSANPAAQTVIGGTSDHTFANWVFDATDSGTDIKITQVMVPVTSVSASFPDMVTGIELWDGSTEILVNSETVAYSDTGSAAGSSATTTLSLSSGVLVIPAGTTKTITIKADLGTGATTGSVAIGAYEHCVTATDDEGSSFDESCTDDNGQDMSLSTGGTVNLSVLTDPSSALVVGGSSGIAVGKFTMQAKYEDVNINYLGVNVAAADGTGIDGDKDEVVSVSLYEDGVSGTLGTVSMVADNATITPSSVLTIPAGTTKNYTLKANFASISDISPAASGSGVRFKVSNLDVTGVAAGSTSITVNGTDTQFKSFSVFKSIPTVTKLAFDGDNAITGNTEVSLYKFKVSADAAGPISLYKFTFGISTTTVVLSNTANDIEDSTGYYVYMSDSEGSLGDLVSVGAAAAAGWQADMNSAGVLNSAIMLEAFFDVGDDYTGTSTEQVIINAGDTKYFTLRGTVASGYVDQLTTTCGISTRMAGDNTFAVANTLSNANGIQALDQNDFIWSDLNADQYSSSTATITAMFFNGYRVSGMPTASTTAQYVSN